jgi:VanZ family protein
MTEAETSKAPAPVAISASTRPTRFSRYAPPVVWATLIFIGSSSLLSANNTSSFLSGPLHFLFPGVGEATLLIIHFVIRKAGHFTEYAILAVLLARALRASSRESLRDRWFLISLVLIIVYALSDEFHQSFVPSRTASIYDSMIDSAGGLFALFVFRRVRKKQDRHA